MLPLLLLTALAWTQDAPMPEDAHAPTFGSVVEREGWWVVDPIAGGKRLQAVSLLFDSGESWIVRYRVRPDDLQWADKRVRIKGRPYWPSSEVQHVKATHLEVHDIGLAAGQTAWDPVPTEVPTPPLVRDLASLTPRRGRWVQAAGSLAALVEEEGGWWSNGRLTLADGELTLSGIRTSWATGLILGQQITVLGRVTIGDEAPALGVRALCPGETPRCGMDRTVE